MSSSNGGGSWGLILAALAGAVGVGLYAYPEYRDVDKVLNLIRKETTAYAKEIGDYVKTKPRYVRDTEDKRATTTKYLKLDPSGVEVESKSGGKKVAVDRLSKDDRKQLNALLNGM